MFVMMEHPHVGTYRISPFLFNLPLPLPEHRPYIRSISPPLLSLRSFDISSTIKGKWFSVSSFISKALMVLLDSEIYPPSEGFAHTEDASISVTVLPDPVVPYIFTMNGRIFSGYIRMLPNDAAKQTSGSFLPDARISLVRSSHVS